MKQLLAFVVTLFAACVGARISSAAPVCIERADVYKLALADMEGTGLAKWQELVTSGHCGNIPASYLFTLDQYKTTDEVTRVAVMLTEWGQVYALLTSLPPNVHMIAGPEIPLTLVRDDPEWENSPPEIRKWFRELMRPDMPYMSCCGEADGYEADMFEEWQGNYVAIITGQGPPNVYKPYIEPGTKIVVPKEKMKWDSGNPTGHGIIFLATDGSVFCYVTPGGI